ncbi:MAG TPA: 3-dehydroquinate synthase [Vicinamibacterales bacterium]|nr:3-dehydroquinate synthase [Vicinamibacterales bacterium]
METTLLTVRAGPRAYEVQIAAGVARRLDDVFDQAGLPTRRFVISSPLVWRLHGEAVAAGLTAEEPILLPDGERFKNLHTVSRAYDALIRAEADRGSAIVAVGGGVIGDMAGFVAATFLRGLPLAHVPTTLLAQIDSSIGGKVGVNHALGKNLVGAFHAPVSVAADPALLATLPRREFRAGLYEAVKYGVIADAELFARLERDLPALFSRSPDALMPMIAASCRIKAAIVEADEREHNVRRLLNFGHTVGHALEAVTKYRRFRHGEAVAYGMLAAAALGVARTVTSAQAADRLQALITQMGPLPPVADLSADETLEAIRRDKKIVNRRLSFAAATTIGAATLLDDVTEDELQASLAGIGLREHTET